MENYNDDFTEANGLDALDYLHEEAKILKKRLENVADNYSNDADIKSSSIKYNRYELSGN